MRSTPPPSARPRRAANRASRRALAALALPLLLCALPSAARADELSDLVTLLGRFPGTDPLSGSFQLDLTRHTKDEGVVKDERSRVAVEVEDGAEGLRIGYPRHELRQAEQELRAQTAEPDKETPVANGLRAVDVTELTASLNAAAALARDLGVARLASVQPSTYGGRPARLLVLRLKPSLSAQARRHVKSVDSQLSVWLGDDGAPLAAERIDKLRAGFLILNFDTLRKQSWTYGRKGNRLYAARHLLDQGASGMGQRYQSVTVAVLTVR
jgi:hypothetical protein